MRQKHFIDSHKGATGVFVLWLIACYQAWENPIIWVYFAMHGTYGFLWIIKSRLFPDAQWEQETDWKYGLGIWGSLSLYWLTPWLIVSGRTNTPPAWFVGCCIMLYVIGVFLHFVSDMQKHILLRERPGVLITEGLWSFVRNPNYLGEFFIYLGFSALAIHLLPLLALFGFMVLIWIPNMRRKDRSLSRYPEFASYQKRSKILFPYLW